MSHTPQTCCGRIWNGRRQQDCGKPAKVEVEGKHYCGIHNPIAIAEKQAKREAKWAEERNEAEKAKSARLEAARRAECLPDLLAALKEVFIIGDELVKDVYGYEFVEKAQAAIKKADGQS